jgi:hypothetical protein
VWPEKLFHDLKHFLKSGSQAESDGSKAVFLAVGFVSA